MRRNRTRPLPTGIADDGLPYPAGAVDELVAEAAAVAQEVPVDLAVIPVADAAERAVAFAGKRVAPEAAEHAHRRRGLEIPLAGGVSLRGLVGEHPGRADLRQVAAERVLEGSVLEPAEVGSIARAEDVEVLAAGVLPVEPNAAVALDTPVHLVVEERAEILVPEGPFVEAIVAVSCGPS